MQADCLGGVGGGGGGGGGLESEAMSLLWNLLAEMMWNCKTSGVVV